MKVLTFTNLYPSAALPRHGIFIEHRVRQLVASGAASVRVVAPVPWVPRASSLFGHLSQYANVAASEVRGPVTVYHPRFFAVPKLTSWLNPFLIALAALPLVRRLQREEDFDLIDAHFFYPDGAAAVLLGRWLGKPVTVTARGTDINEFPQYAVPRRWIKWVTRRAAAMITVSAALRAALVRLGVPVERVSVLRNGVDLELFSPGDTESLRRTHKIDGPTLISVGHLIADKGHQFVIEALASLPDVRLIVVGDGPMRTELAALAERLGVADRVRWTGTLGQRALAEHYAIADATVLASKLEGMPNVLLESLACGTPVIATNVGGSGEVVTAPIAGVLMQERNAPAVVAAYRQLVEHNGAERGTRADVRRYAEQFGWAPTTLGLTQLFNEVIATSRTRAGGNRQSARASG
jgi:teichuronic acid biosynthesis glycosyltransferase TuaC